MIRKIWLKNDMGNIYEFTYKNHTLVTNILGVGASLTNDYTLYESTYKKIDYQIPLTQITLTLIFIEGYHGFKKFTDYLYKSNISMLFLQTEASTRYCYVHLSELPKSELKSNTVISDLKFEKASLWLENYTNTIEINTETVGKVYPHTFPFLFSDSNQGSIELENKGYKPAPTIIHINGAVKDPILYLYQNGTLISSCRIFLETDNEFHKIIIDSRPNAQKIVKSVDQDVTNIYELQDFERDNFLYLPVGRAKVVFDPGKISSATCSIEFVESYLTS